MKIRLILAAVLTALTALSASAQVLVKGSTVIPEGMASSVRATKALAEPMSVPTPSPTPEPSPTPTPGPSPNPPIAVFGNVTNEVGASMAFAQVLVSYVNTWGYRESFQEARCDEFGAFVATPYVWAVPAVGTELLVQATRYQQFPGDFSYQWTGVPVLADSLNVDAGNIVLVPQLSQVWVEAFGDGNDLYVRVRRGKTFPGGAYVSKVFTTAAASTALLTSDAQVQMPQFGRGVRPGLWRQPGWMHFAIPAGAPQGTPLCGWVQISLLSDPSKVVSTEHGFCYNPTARVIGNW